MTIELESVSSAGRSVDTSFQPNEIDLDNAIRLKGAAKLSCEVFRLDGKVHVRGSLAADAELDCVRCLEPVERHLAIDFDDIFVDAAKEETRSESEVPIEDLDESLVSGGMIDLAEIVRERILLEVPAQLLCSDDCRGLCSICGENRNLFLCDCEGDEIDPRWDALRNLN